MPKIRHLAVICMDPEKLAKFYSEVFDMKVVGHSGPENRRNVFLSDGYMSLALLSQKAEGKPCGLNHFGFHVEDQDEIAARLAKAGVPAPAKRPADRPFAETRAFDPDGNNFDISVAGFGMVDDADAKTKAKVPA